MRKQLVHRFFPNAHVFVDFAAIAFQVQRVDEKDLLRRQLIGGKRETAWRHDGAARFPRFRPRADRLQAAGDRDLLRFLLTFPRWKIRTDVDFESAQRLDGEGGMLEIAHFLQADDVGGELPEIAMDCANLPIFFGARSVGPPAGKPLDVPKGGGDGGRRTDAGATAERARSCLGGESSGEEGDREESRTSLGSMVAE